MAPRPILLMSSGFKRESRYACLSETKASHSQRIWAEVSLSAPHLLHIGLPDSAISWKCVLRVLCPVTRPVTALDCVLLKDRNLALARTRGPKINPRACLWVSPRPCHHIQCWLTNERLMLFRVSCLETPKAGSGLTNFTTEQSLVISFVGVQILLWTCILLDSQQMAGRDLVDSWSCKLFPIVVQQSIGTEERHRLLWPVEGMEGSTEVKDGNV